MSHIPLTNDLPGIQGLLVQFSDTAKPLTELAQTLLRNRDSSLTPGERELIAAHVSSLNECRFCFHSHAAAAAAFLGVQVAASDRAAVAWDEVAVSPKMHALLEIAGAVQRSGRNVTPAMIENARAAGATDKEVHDTVLIAAAFCMFNRYVDGLGTWSPERREDYVPMGMMLAEQGYVRPR
jgi:uncharacterized peroxidase-related enzyme